MIGDDRGEYGMLGKCDTSKVAPMRRAKDDPSVWEWVIVVPIGAKLEFKLVTVDPGDAVVEWSTGAAIKVEVPSGCSGVDVEIDWPVRYNRDGANSLGESVLSVSQKIVVEKALHEYRVETGGAWLAYGTKLSEDEGDDTGDTKKATDFDDPFRRQSKDTRGALRWPRKEGNAQPESTVHDDNSSDAEHTSETNSESRVVVDAIDAVDIESDGSTSADTTGHFVRADVSIDEGDIEFSADESTDDGLDDAFETVDEGDTLSGGELGTDEPNDTDDEGLNNNPENHSMPSRETIEARRAAGYVVGSHLENMSGGKNTELVVNAAVVENGIRVGVIEDGRLVETWYEDSAGPGEGMRVGDVYLGVVAKVIGGMQGVLVDVTGKGPPYSLMQKGVDEPALAWRKADATYYEELEQEQELLKAMEENERDGGLDSSGGQESSVEEFGEESSEVSSSEESYEESTSESYAQLDSARRIERLERKARSSSIGAKAGGRWADAWAEGVGVSDSFDAVHEFVGGNASVAAQLDAVELDADGEGSTEESTDTVTVATASRDLDETEDVKYRRRKESRDETNYSNNHNEPTHFGWAPWRRGGGVVVEDEEGDLVDASDTDHTNDDSTSTSEKLTKTQRRNGRGVVDDWVPGMPVVVQVTRLGSGHKGPRVTARPTLPGRNVVLCPDGEGVYVSRKLAGAARAYVKSVGTEVAPSDCALIMRTEAAGVGKEVLATDIGSLASDWTGVRDKATAAVTASGEHGQSPMPRRLLDAATVEQILVRDLFGERVARLVVDSVRARDAIVADLKKTGATEETINKVELLEPDHKTGDDVWDLLGLRDSVLSATEERVWLSNDENLPGAHLVIQQTEALTAVDVNAGRAAFSNEGNIESIAFAVNEAAAKEMAVQLRLRDIGGLVMIDFIDMGKRKHRRAVELAFLEAARADRAQVTFLPISPLGVMEVARERLQGNHSGRRVVADEKGMPVDLNRPAGGPRRVKAHRPPPWATRGGGGARGRGRGDYRGDSRDSREDSSRNQGSGFRGFRDSRNRRTDGRGGPGSNPAANHSGSFYGGVRRGRGGRGGRGGDGGDAWRNEGP